LAANAKQNNHSSAQYSFPTTGPLVHTFSITPAVRLTSESTPTTPKYIIKAPPNPAAPPATRQGSDTPLGDNYDDGTVTAGPAEGFEGKFKVRWSSFIYDLEPEAKQSLKYYREYGYKGAYKLSQNKDHEIHWDETLEVKHDITRSPPQLLDKRGPPAHTRPNSMHKHPHYRNGRIPSNARPSSLKNT
jgi:hypothetical protein